MTVTINGTTGYSGPVGTIGDLTTTGNTTLGDASGDTLTINGSTTTLTQGTANGVAYLNGSKALTTGTALVFDGTNLGVGAAALGTAANRTVITVNGTNDSLITMGVGGARKASMYHDGTNMQLNNEAAGYLLFSTSNTERMRLDSSGNLGLGVTPSAWGGSAGSGVLQQKNGGALFTNTSNDLYLCTNMYFDGTDNRYIATGYAGQFSVKKGSGGFSWNIAGSGTAGAIATFTQAMTLTAAGRLGVGTTSPFQLFEVRGGQAQFSNGGDFVINSDASAVNLYGASNVPMIFYTNTSERARIDTSGNFLVNSTAVGAIDNGAPQISLASAVTSSQWTSRIVSRNTGNSTAAFLGNYKASTSVAGVFAHNAALSAWATLYVNTVDGTIANAGDVVMGSCLFIGTTTKIGNPKIMTIANDSTAALHVAGGSTSVNYAFTFYNPSASGVGSVSFSNTTTTYATSSDYRLKENVQPMVGALTKVAALKPCTYTWKSDGSAGEGFIAHELAEVMPHAVVGEKDAVDENGSPKYQGIDTSFLVATLTAAIQELKAEFDAYKSTHP